jgi:hypothetical protein
MTPIKVQIWVKLHTLLPTGFLLSSSASLTNKSQISLLACGVTILCSRYVLIILIITNIYKSVNSLALLFFTIYCHLRTLWSLDVVNNKLCAQLTQVLYPKCTYKLTVIIEICLLDVMLAKSPSITLPLHHPSD